MESHLAKAKEYTKLGNIEKALVSLSYLEGSNYEKFYLNLKSRYEILEHKYNSNQVSSSDYSLEINKIINSIFYFIEIIEKEDEIEDDSMHVDKIFHDNFKRKLDNKSRELVKGIINQPKENESFILSIIKEKQACTINMLVKESGFKEKKVLRIINRLKKKGQVTEIKDNQLILK